MFSQSTEEKEPLLREIRIQSANEPSQKKSHDLLDEINACRSILQAIQQQIPKKNQSLRNDQRIFTSCCMIILLAAMGETSILIALAVVFAISAQADLIKQLRAQLKLLQSNIVEKQHLINLIDGGLKILDGQRDEVISRQSPIEDTWEENCHSWIDNNGTIHNIHTDFPGFGIDHDLCWFDNHNKTHPMAECNPLATSWCQIEQEKTTIKNKWIDLYEKRQLTNAYLDDLRAQAENLSAQIDETMQATPPIEVNSTVAAIAVGLVVAVGLILLIRSWSRQRQNYQYESTHANDLQHCLKNTSHLDRINKLAARLDINTSNMTVHAMIARLTLEIVNRKKPFAFFSCALHSKATNFKFLQTDMSSDVSRIILEYAEMLPKKKPGSP